jgi:hypothetical protein
MMSTMYDPRLKVELVVEGTKEKSSTRWGVRVFIFSWQAAGEPTESEFVCRD